MVGNCIDALPQQVMYDNMKKYNKFSVYNTSTNRNARIRSRVTKNNKVRTETCGRDSGISAAISTDTNGSTRVFIDMNGDREWGPAENRSHSSIELNGREARTLYRMLVKHYEFNGQSLA